MRYRLSVGNDAGPNGKESLFPLTLIHNEKRRCKLTDERPTLWGLLFFCFAIVAAVSCSRLNERPPSYIRDVTAYKEGSDGLMVYFVLADANGAMTTSDGTVSLRITQTRIAVDPHSFQTRQTDEHLYSTDFKVKKKEFRKTKVGLGAFERDVILYAVGRIPYSSFAKRPSEPIGKVSLWFQTPDNRPLQGEGTIIF